MFIKKAFIALGLCIAFANATAAEKTDTTDTNQQNQTISPTNQQSQKTGSDQTSAKNKSSLNQQASPEKKPSMADYCRKHTC